jgi:hypothetical protein
LAVNHDRGSVKKFMRLCERWHGQLARGAASLRLTMARWGEIGGMDKLVLSVGRKGTDKVPLTVAPVAK